MSDELPLLYTELAGWYHLLTAPDDYAEEAAFYWGCFTDVAETSPQTLLELGSGGGNMAWHYKQHVTATLTDLSAEMLALSRTINPELEHIQGDMRTLRLGRTFDAVFVHDAVMYLTTESDLRQAMDTAFAHLRPGGVAVFAPDFVQETYKPSTDHGGHDGTDGRALRYLEWTHDPDPTDSVVAADFVYVLREGDGPPRSLVDRHSVGLFSRKVWLRLLHEAGFQDVSVRLLIHSEVPLGDVEVFTAICRQ
ncbi:MAG: trans-aconitate 2-methyltransferase [Chloroflexota bacterium]